MNTSDSIKNIAPALLQAQKEITFAKKDALNPHFKNSYADLPTVIDAVKRSLNNNGICFIQSSSKTETGDVLHLTTRLLHSPSGEWIQDTASCPLPKKDPQGFGSAMTYLRRYTLAAMVGLYQDDDDGNHASGRGEPPSNRSQHGVMQELAQGDPERFGKALDYYDVGTMYELTEKQANDLISKFNIKKAKQ